MEAVRQAREFAAELDPPCPFVAIYKSESGRHIIRAVQAPNIHSAHKIARDAVNGDHKLLATLVA